jgi:hypothetical protein
MELQGGFAHTWQTVNHQLAAGRAQNIQQLIQLLAAISESLLPLSASFCTAWAFSRGIDRAAPRAAANISRREPCPMEGFRHLRGEPALPTQCNK